MKRFVLLGIALIVTLGAAVALLWVTAHRSDAVFTTAYLWDDSNKSEPPAGESRTTSIPVSVPITTAAPQILPSVLRDPGFGIWNPEGGYYSAATESTSGAPMRRVAAVREYFRPSTGAPALTWQELESTGEYGVFVNSADQLVGLFSLRRETVSRMWQYSPEGPFDVVALADAMASAEATSPGPANEIRLVPAQPVSWIAVRSSAGVTWATPVGWTPGSQYYIGGRRIESRGRYPVSAIVSVIWER